MVQEGEVYKEVFSFTQKQVEEFAKFSNDTNPIHLDAEYAAKTHFKKPIMHGMIGGTVISKTFGINFHGGGFIYVSQLMEFKRPMYPDVTYELVITTTHLDRDRHIGTFTTDIFDKETGKLCTTGKAQVMHKDKI
jgi:acyl dehydratase